MVHHASAPRRAQGTERSSARPHHPAPRARVDTRGDAPALRWWPVVVLACLPAIAVLVSAMVAAGRDPIADSDAAVTEIWVRTALDGDALVGPYSRFGWHHPGPTWFYLAAAALPRLRSRCRWTRGGGSGSHGRLHRSRRVDRRTRRGRGRRVGRWPDASRLDGDRRNDLVRQLLESARCDRAVPRRGHRCRCTRCGERLVPAAGRRVRLVGHPDAHRLCAGCGRDGRTCDDRPRPRRMAVPRSAPSRSCPPDARRAVGTPSLGAVDELTRKRHRAHHVRPHVRRGARSGGHRTAARAPTDAAPRRPRRGLDRARLRC